MCSSCCHDGRAWTNHACPELRPIILGSLVCMRTLVLRLDPSQSRSSNPICESSAVPREVPPQLQSSVVDGRLVEGELNNRTRGDTSGRKFRERPCYTDSTDSSDSIRMRHSLGGVHIKAQQVPTSCTCRDGKEVSEGVRYPFSSTSSIDASSEVIKSCVERVSAGHRSPVPVPYEQRSPVPLDSTTVPGTVGVKCAELSPVVVQGLLGLERKSLRRCTVVDSNPSAAVRGCCCARDLQQ